MKRIRWVRHVACKAKKRNAYIISVRKVRIETSGKPDEYTEDNIKIIL
jgi:hypothetical protein